jgi:uncharacterized membrane protein
MSPLRWALVALLIASTTLFGIGAIAEHSSKDSHAEPAAVHAETEGEAAEHGGAHREAASETTERERLLGVDVESTPLVILGVLAGLALAALAASRIGARRGFLLAVVVIGLAWVALDIREVIHQLDESRTAIAVVAMAVAALHLAVVAISARLATVNGAGTRPVAP